MVKPMLRLALALFIALSLHPSALLAQDVPHPPPLPPRPWGQLVSTEGQVSELHKPEIILGSDPNCDVVIKDSTIAPRHFRLIFSRGNATIEDLGSKTGTLVAGRAIKPGQPFKITNEVEIDPGAATLKFTFVDRGRVEPSQPVTERKKPVDPPKGKAKKSKKPAQQ